MSLLPGETPTTPCQAAEFSRWDKLFIALEDSHMRQNMLLESVSQCCGGMASLRNQVEKLVKGSLPRLESTCRAQAEQARAWLKEGLVELEEKEAERERKLNATLQQLLQRHRDGNASLKRPEEPGAGSGMRHQPTQVPRRKTFTSVLKEQEVTSPLDMAAMETALVVIATELQKVHLQLTSVIEQAGTLRKDRGDT